MTELPSPFELGLPADAIVAIPAQGLVVYRLVGGPRPKMADFQPQSPERAERAGWPEILRAGLSHFLTPEMASRSRLRAGSRIAAVTLPGGAGVYVARTGRRSGHVTVWARGADLLAQARVIDV